MNVRSILKIALMFEGFKDIYNLDNKIYNKRLPRKKKKKLNKQYKNK